MKTGGSNYITINGSLDCPVIGTYHLYPEVVASDLASMFEHGQRKITLVCWFAPLNFPAAEDDLWHHVVNSYGGAMSDQHQQNVIALLGLINQMGYNELHFRFAPQGRAMNAEWAAWNGHQFNENWNFVDSVRDLVDVNKGNLRVVFDLALEHANERLDTSQIHALYCRRLWKLYTEAHGSSDSCAFSVIHGVAGLEPMLRRFREAGLPLPACYCFDAYGFEYQSLTTAAPLIPQGAPVFMQETLYNDAASCADIRRAVSETGLNFHGVFQWPKLRDRDPHDFPDVFPKRFDNYLVEI